MNPKPEILEQLLKEDNKIFQEPLNKKISTENIEENDANKDSIVMGSSNNLNNLGNSMDVEEEDKSAIVSRMDSNLNLNNNNSVLSIDKGGVLIPNVEQYFGKIDDSSQFKELQEKNQFILQEIEKLKKELNIKEEEIMKLNKEIRKNKI